jgi:hypothetical protein
MIHSRVSRIRSPVERSITVSALQWTDQWSFDLLLDRAATAEFLMFAFTLQRKLRPMIIGSSSR